MHVMPDGLLYFLFQCNNSNKYPNNNISLSS